MNWSLTLCVVLLLTFSLPTHAKDMTTDDEHSKYDEGDTSCWKEYTAAALLGGTAALAAAPIVLGAAGFTAAGVTAGSVAAGVQSAVYGGTVASTSAFAALQSAGAAGLSAAAKTVIFAAGSWMATSFKNVWAPCEEGPKCSSDKE